jgi:hypothetical protein
MPRTVRALPAARASSNCSGNAAAHIDAARSASFATDKLFGSKPLPKTFIVTLREKGAALVQSRTESNPSFDGVAFALRAAP